MPKSPARAAVKFPPQGQLRKDLQSRVDAYFAGGRPRQGDGRMVAKSVVILAWTAVSYLLLLVWASSVWQVGLLAVSLGLAVAGVGFAIQHDGGHGAYSRSKATNRLAAFALDAVGGSSYVWRFKHNIIHHTHTNVHGVDDDLEAGVLLRLTPSSRRYPFHRFQHWYFWALYGLLPIKWHWFDDYYNIATGRIGKTPFPRPRGWDLVQLIAGKLLFYGWTIALPLALGHSLAAVLATYLVASFVLGVTLAVVFQLAHCVEEAQMMAPPAAGQRMPFSWMEHQLRTTVNFAPRNRLLSWYLGGLNFQREHHLFPHVSHLHYPELAPIVTAVCREHGAPAAQNDTFLGALRSHVRFLRRLGAA